jgi:hypothetical protein
MSRITEILQGPDESLRQFSELLLEVFCLYTTFDIEVAKK